MAAAGARAGFPAASKCMLCHRAATKDSPTVRRLAALAADTPIVSEKPLYELPDFVIYSHARHKTGKISCDTCHGNVWARDSVKLELNMKMKACIDCHKKYQAAVNCTACHELNQ
jgi:Cytochrome c7 and related cytochrome c